MKEGEWEEVHIVFLKLYLYTILSLLKVNKDKEEAKRRPSVKHK